MMPRTQLIVLDALIGAGLDHTTPDNTGHRWVTDHALANRTGMQRSDLIGYLSELCRRRYVTARTRHLDCAWAVTPAGLKASIDTHKAESVPNLKPLL